MKFKAFTVSQLLQFTHGVSPTATNRENLHKLLYKRLDELLRLAKARKTVMFALDGPAPLAKLLTQR